MWINRYEKGNSITGDYSVKPAVPPLAPKQEKPKIDVSGAAVSSAVRHGKFGDGRVITLDSKYITVQFVECEKRRGMDKSLVLHNGITECRLRM